MMFCAAFRAVIWRNPITPSEIVTNAQGPGIDEDKNAEKSVQAGCCRERKLSFVFGDPLPFGAWPERRKPARYVIKGCRWECPVNASGINTPRNPVSGTA